MADRGGGPPRAAHSAGHIRANFAAPEPFPEHRSISLIDAGLEAAFHENS